MTTRSRCFLMRLSLLIASSAAPLTWAQTPNQPTPEVPAAREQEAMMQGGDSAKMEHMADAMTSMAQTCETMMKMEMQRMAKWSGPLMAACIAFGLLLAVALVLFIVLEIQWIRLTSARIKSAKRSTA